MTVVYIIAFLIFAFFICVKANYYSMIRSVNQDNTDLPDIPVIYGGKKPPVFTIEKSDLIHATTTISIDMLSYIIAKLLGWLGLKLNLYHDIGEHAYQNTLNKIIKKAPEADYLVNLNIKHLIFNKRYVTCWMTCNAIYMFPDTLPLFNIPPTINFKKHFSITGYIKSVFVKLCGMLLIIYAIAISSDYLAFYMAKKADLATEEAIWSYIQPDVNFEEVTRLDLLECQQKIQQILDDLPETKLNNYYDFKIHIIDSDEIDSIPLPAGHIVFTRGLVETITSKNELVFLLAHEMAHYEDNEHLTALGNDYLTMYLSTRLFGKNSFLGEMVVWYWDFKEIAFNEKQEIKADEYALFTLQGIFKHVGGFNSLQKKLSNVSEAFQPILVRHVITSNRTNSLANLVKEHNFAILAETPVNYSIKNKNSDQTQKFVPGELTFNDRYTSLFEEYKKDMNALYQSYESVINEANNMLKFNEGLTLNELQIRKNNLAIINDKMLIFKTKFSGIIRQYDEIFENFLHKIQDSRQKIMLYNVWSKEKQVTGGNIRFYIERDHSIIEVQETILDYLIQRWGTFKITNYGLEFSTPKEASDYQDLINNIDNLLKNSPPYEN